MRLRKLILSTGLAVAMVATTIPVGASVRTTEATSTVTGTEGLATNDGKAVNDTTDFVAAITGVSKATKNQSITGVSGLLESKGLGNLKLGEGKDGGAATKDIKNLDTSYKFDSNGKYVSAFEIIQTTVYETKGYEYTLVSDDVTANTTSTTDANKNNVNVTKERIVASIVKDLGVKEVTNKEFDYGTKTVVVANDTTNGLDNYTENGVATKVGDKVSIPDGKKVTVTTTYNVTTLPSGYRYDILLGTVNANEEFVVAVGNVDGSEKLVTDYTETQDGVLVSTTTLVDNTFYLGKKTVSASGKLLFAPTEGNDSANADVVSGDYTAHISNNDQTEIDLTEVADLPEDVESAGNFDIVVTKDGAGVVANGPEMTFKIAIPKDVQPTSADKKINWIVVRGHNYNDGNGVKYEIIPSTVEGDYIVFNSDKFSTYALLYNEVAADAETPAETPAEDPTTEAPANEETQALTTTEAANGTSTTSKTSSSGTADNSMMPIVVVSLLLALCAGSVAVYKEKKTL